MLRVKIYPAVDFLVAYAQTRGFLIVNDKPNILHYTGSNDKELQELVKEDKPDLLVLNNKYFGNLKDVFWVYHLARTVKEFYKTRKIYTNNFRLCQLYFQKLGLQAEIILMPGKEEAQAKEKGDIRFRPSSISWFKNLFSKIASAMEWE